MPERGSRRGGERVNAFDVDGAYCFKHYFEGEAVFARLRRYYEHNQYRFSVPAPEFDGVRRFLDEHGYDVVPVADVAPYVVAVRKYTAHPENVFEDSVEQWDRPKHTLFLLKDEDAVEQATAAGATPLAESELSLDGGRQQRLTAV